MLIKNTDSGMYNNNNEKQNKKAENCFNLYVTDYVMT